MIQFTTEQNKFLERRGCGIQFWDRAIEGGQYQCCAQAVKINPDRTSGPSVPGTLVVGSDERDAANKAIEALSRVKMSDISTDAKEELAAKDKEIALLKKELARASAGAPQATSEEEIASSEAEAENKVVADPDAFVARRRRGRPPKNAAAQADSSA